MRIFLLILAISAAAKPPVLDALWPAGAPRGSEFELLAVGKQESWPVSVWCDAPGVAISALSDTGKLAVRIAADAKTGPCFVRLHNADGASPLRSFVVSDRAEVAEVEPNDSWRTPQPLDALPALLNGRLQKSGDSDFFAFELGAGARLVARVDGYSLGSPIDPFLHLYAADGAEIAFASDSHNRDPILVHAVASAGRYLLQVLAFDHKASTNVRFSGSDKSVYRLSVAVSDAPRFPKPAGDDIHRLKEPGAEVEHILSLTKGESRLLKVEAAALHLPLDPILRVLRPDGRLLKEVDDSNKTADPEYLLVAAMDGDHKAYVRDRFGRGGPDFWYRFVAASPRSCQVTASVDRVSVKAGETAELKLKLTRLHGHDAALEILAGRLPLGVSLEVPEIPSKTADLTLKLAAAADAPAASAELQLTLREGDTIRPIPYSFLSDESRGDFLRNESPALWLTVTR